MVSKEPCSKKPVMITNFIQSGSLELQFVAAKRASHKARVNRDTSTLSIVFSRLYTHGIQLIHGGATFES